MLNEDLTNCEVKFPATDKQCHNQKANGDGEIKNLQNFKFTYFSAPPSVACSQITEVSCKRGGEVCKIENIESPFPNLFVNALDATNCEIAKSPKILG